MKDIKKNAARAATLLKLLANKNRLMVLCHLVEGEQCVSDLLEHVEIGQSALSQNLIRMRNEGILTTRREGNLMYYRIADDIVLELLQVLYQHFCEEKK